MKSKNHSLVGIIMGSKSDWKTMFYCSDTLKKFGIKHEVRVISAHRTPVRLHKFLNEAKKKKTEVCSELRRNRANPSKCFSEEVGI